MGKQAFFLVHLENQSEERSAFKRRMFRYFSRLLDLHELPIYPIVVLSYNKPKKVAGNSYQVSFPDFMVLSFNYRVVQLNQLNWRDFLNKPNPLASALMAKMNIKASERPKVKLECLRLLVTLKLDRAKMKLISGFVDTYLKLNAKELQVFNKEIDKIIPSEKEQIMEIVTSWMQDGIQQGLVQGRKEGELALILRLVNKRFGAIDPSLQDKIEVLTLGKLEELGEALFDFNSIADLASWLDAV